ncbi:MAG: AAA family ATPase [Phycisphaerales bacterium]|nr:AAA family ATPase [Planctomycetota bacterium]MCH8507512.1 AAA family ATPase [Phycisphaerales bacterium]
MTSDFARRTGREENTAWNTASPETRTTPASARHAGDDDLGRRVRDGLTAAVGEHRIARLLGTHASIRCADDAVEICLPDRFSAEIVERNLGDALRLAADQVIPGRDIRVRVDEQLADAPANRAAAPAGPPRTPPAGPGAPTRPGGQGPKRTPVPPFLVGAANRVAHEAVRRAACEPDASDLVFVHGPCGVGKTHLLRHAAGLCRRQRPNARIRVTSGELFISGYINAIKNSTVDEFQKRHRRLDLLVIDDVHVIAGKDGTQQELIRTLNDLLMTGARVVLASDAHPRDIVKLHAALSSRLVSGVVAPIERPDADLVRRLVPALAKRRGIVLDPKGQDILVQRILEDREATVRDIEGTLTQVQAMASLLDRDRGLFLTAEHVRQAVEMRAGERPGIRPGPVSIEKIIDTVCRELAVTRDDLGGKGRAKKVVLAREIIVHLGKRHTGRSYPELAMAIGRPNHSTVITAHQRFQQRVKTEDPIAVGAAFDGTTAGELTTRMERAMGL